ncbi:MAG: 4-(cytidine 5'-diphospho)-2-C-methyl-D-erythritol kinase [Symbiobacteriaceae bacterium]|nr:4-(cytidine 5'-diphospho)-2-C-methyl-D-erythritol kinase [Symbiobacteriaceae bacterium]
MITLAARGKINLTLDILRRRDDGYHELRSVMQSIDLYDRLYLTPHPELELTVETRRGVARWIPQDERNDVLRGALLLREKYNLTQGAQMKLIKHIPSQAGLGGGSADAAAALLGLNSLWKLQLTWEELQSLAASLGSDTVFALTGGTAIASGRGETITSLPPLAKRWLALFKPPRGLATSRVFQSFSLKPSYELTTDLFIQAMQDTRLDPMTYCSNHLQETALQLLPDLREFADQLQKKGVRFWQLSGSGSTIFVVAESQEHARDICHQLTPRGWWSVVTSTAPVGISYLPISPETK